MKYTFEIKKHHEAEDICDAVEEMLEGVRDDQQEHVCEWVADTAFSGRGYVLRRKLVDEYLNQLKVNGWTGDIADIFEPYLDIAITKVLKRGAERIDPGSSGDPDVCKAQQIVRQFQEQTGLAYNWLLNYFLAGATPYMLHYLVETALLKLSVDERKMVASLITPYIPLAVSERLKGENDGQASDKECMASC